MITPTVDANVWGWRWLRDVSSVFFIKLCNKFLIKLNAIILTIMDIEAYFKKIIILWMKTIHYSNKIRSHLVTIVPMAPFTPRSTSKLRSVLHFRHSMVIPRFIPRANTA